MYLSIFVDCFICVKSIMGHSSAIDVRIDFIHKIGRDGGRVFLLGAPTLFVFISFQVDSTLSKCPRVGNFWLFSCSANLAAVLQRSRQRVPRLVGRALFAIAEGTAITLGSCFYSEARSPSVTCVRLRDEQYSPGYCRRIRLNNITASDYVTQLPTLF